MRKVVIHRAGSYERLTLETHPDPSPARTELVVAPLAIGVNYADAIVRMGLYASARHYVGWPITPGFEAAGEVVAVGADVTRYRPGDFVLCLTRFGGYATRIVVPEHQAFGVPAGLTAAEAASFPVVFLTAWYALRELVKLRAGMTLLVHSAAGGVGGALTQIAVACGARVVGVVGAAHKTRVAREQGATAVIDKSTQALWPAARREAPSGYDVVLDANGASTLRQSFRQLAPAGKLVIYGFHGMIPRRGGKPNWLKLVFDFLRTPRFDPFRLTNENKSVLAFNLSYLFDRTDLLEEAMAELLGWLEEGKLRPLPVREIPFDRVADAHRAIESGQTVGKLVLVP